MSAWRHARAIALLPGTVTVAVPAIILVTGEGPAIGWELHGLSSAPLALAGIALVVAGLTLWVWTVRLLARVGQGTLARGTQPGGSWWRVPTGTCATR